MKKKVVQKIFYLVWMLLLISLISFFAIHLAPNSFLSAGELNPNITKETLEHLKAIYGLDKPLWQQYISWLWALLHFDFGISFASGKPVIEEIMDRIGITLGINLVSMVIIFVISFSIGIVSALKEGSFIDRFFKNLSLISFSMPSFYLALLLIIIFSVKLGWFPISGLHSLEPKTGFAYYIDLAWHLVLPIFVVVFVGFGTLAQYIRSLTQEILKSDYIFFAKARGVEQQDIIKYYIISNLKPPIITMLGLSLPGIIGGSVILESIFSINGMGLLFYQAAMARDYPVILGILIITSFLTLLGNIVADLVLLRLNPYAR
ncbi:peptide/nickel transport system permease protein [Nitratiruptor sp. YY08-26]|uniref:ABC transporter permease n=1 Tax=unclassified Nitratiruptor TaxID=2624044 RepID=UPI001915FB13|nr:MULTISPECIES: ABC transporter permease [unclassified Nitratiruptor]BCD62768.1 peptide/nickel transport system permease protein [Nitratiruptor sp. YY08-13]BCD66704.1 peptide/nickel transport system permease protein [Nitratiruptor sp. YY08-26]